MTQSEFNDLPGLLARKQFMQATGLTRDDVRELLKSKQIKRYFPRKGGYGKYYKADAARVAGFSLS